MNMSLVATKNWVAGYPPILYNQVFYEAGFYIYYDTSPSSPSPFVCEKKNATEDDFVVGESNFHYRKENCGGLAEPTNTYLKVQGKMTDSYTSKDAAFCSNLQNPNGLSKTMKNHLDMPELPSLRRPRLAFHYIGGTFKEDIEPTQLQLKLTQKETNVTVADFQDQLFNNGTLGNITEWNFADVPLQRFFKSSKLRFEGEFQSLDGVIGLDNVRLYTRQKCSPRWSILPNYKFSDLTKLYRSWRRPLSVFEGSYESISDLNSYVGKPAVTLSKINVEECMR